jgi:ubiquinone/menaquinone biosynthesis C-methylase UbiE
MKLTQREFNAMNNPLRRLFQRLVEYPNFRRMGMRDEGGDILEIGCGSGYGALLLSRLHPHSYEGVDLMPEQIALAQKAAHQRGLDSYVFRVADAAQLDSIPAQSKDTTVIFGVLHHIPEWRKVVSECARVLREGGKLFLEEPDGSGLAKWDRMFHWDHATHGIFYLRDLEQELATSGFEINRQVKGLVFGVYAAQKCRVAKEGRS